MSANTTPIWALNGNVGWAHTDGDGGAAGPLKTANTAADGTGTVLTIYQAPANGAWVHRVQFRAAGTNVATVARVFMNKNASNATLGNNCLMTEITCPGTTVSQVAAQPPSDAICDFFLPPNYKLMVTIGTTVSAGFFVSAIVAEY